MNKFVQTENLARFSSTQLTEPRKRKKKKRDQYLSNTSLSVATFKGVRNPSIETEDQNVPQEDFPEVQEVS